ncbi:MULTISPECIES: hypothetical protein [unclassified Calothrix]|uniref:hypothetical protein n=1 Tax=unclassified Calothrix TaxID=2619626 RepID=UPI0016826FE2|nr:MULTISPECIES: hypothetical protein [unclassified Calothrix]MBD2207848.1 hypothetical protein [Calothrix sp. FACHB-168]
MKKYCNDGSQCEHGSKNSKNPVKGKDDRPNPHSLVPSAQPLGKIRKTEEPITQSPHAESIRAVGLFLGIKPHLLAS